MRLVRDHKLLTNTKAKAKAASLRTNQQRFLSNMETCITWELSTLDLVDSTTGANLRQFIMNIPDPEKPEERLFHAVNKMLRHDGHIFRFNPNRSQSAREIVAGLLVYLKGMWIPTVEPSKFNKFFTGSAIERAADAWWDTQERCVVTKADAELEELINQDSDLMFPEDIITVDMTQVVTEEEVGMSTGSISTFRTTATPQVKAGARLSNKRGSTQAPKATSADQASALTSTSMSEVEFTALMQRVTEALQIQSPQPKSPPGGSETGKAS